MSETKPDAAPRTQAPATHAPLTPEVLDARGLLCPLPVIRTQDRVRGLAPGTLLDVVATDPGVLHDIPAWCRVHGHEVLQTAEAGREITVRLRVGTKSRSSPRAPSLRN